MEWTKSFLKHMEILKKADKYYDHDLKKRVKNALYSLDENINDEQAMLWGYMDDSEDEEESWNCVHSLANQLSI